MTRKTAGNSRLLALVALLTAVAGCDTNSTRKPGTQFSTPVIPTAIQITISSDRSSIRAGTTTSALITWSAIFLPQGTPVPNGTLASVSTSLGSLNSLGGGTSAEIEMFGGTASVRLFAPTTGTGTARVRVEIDGVVAVVEITITSPAAPPTPAPTASDLTLIVSPTSFLEAGTFPVELDVRVIVHGSDGQPLDNAPVNLITELGTFTITGGSVVGTDSDGEVNDTLEISTEQFAAWPPDDDAFVVTAVLGVAGGTRTDTATVTIIRADDPPVAFSLTLTILPDATLDRDSATDPQTATLQALVLDQYNDPFVGQLVTFSTDLGSLDFFNDTTDGDGLASVVLSVTQAALDGFASSSFEVNAFIPADPVNSQTIIISGTPDAELVPTNVTLFSDVNFIEDDSDTFAEVLNLTGLVTDQNGDPLDDVVVTFSSTFGTPAPLTDDTGDVNPGEAESVLTLADAAVTAFIPNTFTVTATITTSGGTDTSSLVINIIRPPQADFAFSGTSGTKVVNFDDNSTGGPTAWAWDFDNSTTVESTVQNPTFNYGTSGFACAAAVGCSATLTVTNAAGFSTVTKFVPLPLP